MKYITILLLSAMTLVSCDKKQSAKSEDVDCTQYPCTLNFNIIRINITNTQGDLLPLDDFYTLRTSTGEKIVNQGVKHSDGRYVVLTDAYRMNFLNKTEEFVFYGTIAGQVAVKETFTISADCCHISREAGNTEVVAGAF